MKAVLFSTLFALALVPLAAPAAAPVDAASAAQVDALIDAMDVESRQRAMLDQLDASMRQMAETMLGEDADAEDRARFERMRTRQHAELLGLVTSDRMVDVYRQALRQTLTAGEVEAMTAFYNSHEGRSAMNKMPAIMGVIMREMQPMFLEMVEKSRREFEAEFAKSVSGGD